MLDAAGEVGDQADVGGFAHPAGEDVRVPRGGDAGEGELGDRLIGVVEDEGDPGAAACGGVPADVAGLGLQREALRLAPHRQHTSWDGQEAGIRVAAAG